MGDFCEEHGILFYRFSASEKSFSEPCFARISLGTVLFFKLNSSVLWTRYDTTTTAEFASRMTEDLNKMQDGMGEKVGMLIR